MAKKTEKPAALPEQIDEVDALKYDSLQLQLNNLELQRQLIQSKQQVLIAEFHVKYKLTSRDVVDIGTRNITRAPEETPAE